MFRIRRLILRLAILLAGVPIGGFAVLIVAGALVSTLGNSGHPFGDRYVVRYISDHGTLEIFRDSDYWISIGLDGDWLLEWIGWYGVLCLAVAMIEGTVRFAERRNNRRPGFEVITTRSVSFEGPCPSPAPPSKADV